ncbi:MAG: PAS domain-containing protein [candidate division Zixibacteria bacterium]|nr:PAS domain-containing protein [candidate division Zixibacteria bacterium]
MVPEEAPTDNICAQMISVMSDMVILVNLDGMVIVANQSTFSLLGYSEEEILDHPIQKILSISQDNENKLSSNKTIGERLLDEALANIEGFMTPKEGNQIPISLRSSAIEGCPRVGSGIVLVARDLRPTKKLIADAARAEAERRKRKELQQAYDELKQLQEQLIQSEKMASIGQIAAGVAHEINNPISGIMVYLHSLANDIENDQFDRKQALTFLNDSKHELTRCSKIIKRLLDFSRQSQPMLAPLNLDNILDESYSILDYRAKLQDIEMVYHIDSGLPRIEADSDQLKQVFLNLILNAIQAMPHGGHLTIRATQANDRERPTKNTKVVLIDVEDTGCGISKENIDKVFTPFFTTKEKGEGIGLGLAVAYGIIKRHGGDLRVKSSKGKGTTFSIFLKSKEELE